MPQNNWPPEWMDLNTRTKVEKMVLEDNRARACMEIMNAHKKAQRLSSLTLSMASRLVGAAQEFLKRQRNISKGRWDP